MTKRRFRTCWIVTLLALVAASPQPARALALAIRAPMIVSDPASIEFDSVDMGVAQVNPLGVLHVLEPGYAVTTQAWADDVNGVLAGRAGFGLIPDRPGVLPAAFAESNVTGEGTVSGPPGIFHLITIALDLHGRFVGLDGFPKVGMRGTLSVAGVADAEPTYQVTSAIDWEIPAGLPAVQTTTWAFKGSNPSAAYPAATPLVLSSHPDALLGQARVTFLAEGGSTIFVEADLQGSAEPLVSNGISRAGDGQIDFANTGTLRVQLPPGVEFVNATGVLASDVVVPEPAMGLMVAAGASLLLGVLGRRRAA